MLAIANFSRLIILRFRLNVRQRASKGITYHFGMFQSFQKFLNRACAISVYRTRVSCPSLASEITEAEDGEQALAAVAKERPDLILMGVQLPIMDGYRASFIGLVGL
jgi:hypothetical protein